MVKAIKTLLTSSSDFVIVIRLFVPKTTMTSQGPYSDIVHEKLAFFGMVIGPPIHRMGELIIHNFRVEDVNDNAPRFWRDQYESFLPENSNSFETPLVIQAEDRDENGQWVWRFPKTLLTLLDYFQERGTRWYDTGLSRGTLGGISALTRSLGRWNVPLKTVTVLLFVLVFIIPLQRFYNMNTE